MIWTPELIWQSLVAAFDTLNRMPRVPGPKAPGNHWPKTLTEWTDQLAQATLDPSEQRDRQREANRIVIRPTAEEIANMEKALDWLRQIRQADPGMALVTTLCALYASQHRPITLLCRQKKWAIRTVFRKRAKALAWMAARLNSCHQPPLSSQRLAASL